MQPLLYRISEYESLYVMKYSSSCMQAIKKEHGADLGDGVVMDCSFFIL
jgi:hypothetical protein